MYHTQRKDASPPAVRWQARVLRHDLTEAEALLWQRIRDRKLHKLKFRRQHPIRQFIADFYCAEYKLIVEVDGGIHAQQIEYDALRTAEMEKLGYRVIRLSNDLVLHDIESACSVILDACKQ